MMQRYLCQVLNHRGIGALLLLAVTSAFAIYLYMTPAHDRFNSYGFILQGPIHVQEGYKHLLTRNHQSVRNCISGTHVRHMVNYKSQELTTHLVATGEDSAKRQQAFMRVYAKSEWYDGKLPQVGVYKDVGGSGAGSTLHYAQEVIATLHVIITALKVELKKEKIRFLDIPCGDMVWMSRFLQTREDVEYTGMDIVPNLIARHKVAYKAFPWRFVHQDIAAHGLNASYDIVLSRMMLQHLKTEDASKVLNHISKSGSKYLLTTTFSGQPGNGPLPNNRGRFRFLNLELPPFSLEPPICTTRDGDVSRGIFHYLSLWRLPLQQVSDCNITVKPAHGTGFLKNFYTCA